jgi:unsaturated rhamnogalacturonyl hydrolase
MALVDVLDYIPEEHPRRGEVIQLLKKLSAGMFAGRTDDRTLVSGGGSGQREAITWNLGFCHDECTPTPKAIIRAIWAVNTIRLPTRLWNGLIAHRIVANEDTTISLTYCCAVSA